MITILLAIYMEMWFLFIKAFKLEPLFISLVCVLVSLKKKKGSYPMNASALKSYNHTILFLNDIIWVSSIVF